MTCAFSTGALEGPEGVEAREAHHHTNEANTDRNQGRSVEVHNRIRPLGHKNAAAVAGIGRTGGFPTLPEGAIAAPAPTVQKRGRGSSTNPLLQVSPTAIGRCRGARLGANLVDPEFL